MKLRLSTLIDFFTRDPVSIVPLASEDEERQRHGASMRPERLRVRRGRRARMRRSFAHRLAGAAGCIGQATQRHIAA